MGRLNHSSAGVTGQIGGRDASATLYSRRNRLRSTSFGASGTGLDRHSPLVTYSDSHIWNSCPGQGELMTLPREAPSRQVAVAAAPLGPVGTLEGFLIDS